MNKATYDILSIVQEVYIIPHEIKPSFDGLNSKLSVLVHFLFRQPEGAIFVAIDAVEATLSHGTAQISNTSTLTNFYLDSEKPKEERKDSLIFNFILTDKAIEYIEKNRKDDLQLKIELSFVLNLRARQEIISANNRVQVNSARNIQYKKVDLYVDIPRSQWVSTILPGLHYRSFLLIEVPLNHTLFKEAYNGVCSEFEKAQGYYKNHQYNECVGACRKAMDKLKENLVNLKEKRGTASNYEYLTKINEATFNWIDNMNRNLSRISSQSHHSGDHIFERYEAESVYLITLGLMNYIGHIK